MQRIWSKSSSFFFLPLLDQPRIPVCSISAAECWSNPLLDWFHFSPPTRQSISHPCGFSLWNDFCPPPLLSLFFLCAVDVFERERKKTDPAKIMCYCDNFPTVCELDMDLYFRQPWGETSIQRQWQCEAAAGVQLHVVNLWGWLQARVLLSC